MEEEVEDVEEEEEEEEEVVVVKADGERLADPTESDPLTVILSL